MVPVLPGAQASAREQVRPNFPVVAVELKGAAAA
jgi:hypothetical protein